MHHLDLDLITLDKGQHNTRSAGVCLLEAVAWWAEESHTDHPACVSPVLGAFGRGLNDVLPDEKRQELRPFISLLPGTAGDGHDEARGYLALDWLIRTYTPAWLDLAGLTAEASALRDFRRIADLAAAQAVRSHLLTASDKAAAAWAAARAAAAAAAGDAAADAAAAGDAAGAAAGAAAWAAARAAARAAAAAAAAAAGAARAAARAAAGDAAGDAGRAAAAAGDAGRAAAAAGDAGRAAAAAAARAALKSTVELLQDSAISLYRQMIEATS